MLDNSSHFMFYDIMISQTKLFPSRIVPQQHIPQQQILRPSRRQGDIILSEFKAVMLASLRSLVPKEIHRVQRGGWRFPKSWGYPQ